MADVANNLAAAVEQLTLINSRESVQDDDIHLNSITFPARVFTQWINYSSYRLEGKIERQHFRHTGRNGVKTSIKSIVMTVPAVSAVYEIGISFDVDLPLTTIYCGSTNNLQNRMRDHFSQTLIGVAKTLKDNVASSFIDGISINFHLWMRHCQCSNDEALARERALLFQHNYMLNQDDNDELRLADLLVLFQDNWEEAFALDGEGH